MLRNRRQLRRWAIQVLLVWLFGIVTGIAHACAVRIVDDQRGATDPITKRRLSTARHIRMPKLLFLTQIQVSKRTALISVRRSR